MKELSIEEKAKAYDKAVERAEERYNEEYTSTLERSTLAYVFPELKESEDEKTKRLLHTIANKMGQHLRDIFTEEEYQCFDAWSNAWLKKQGTDISLFSNEQRKYMEKYISLDKVTLIKLLAERDANNAEIIESFEKQGDQKSNPCENCSIATNNCQNFPCTIKDGEQKPAEWSEEDEKISSAIIKRLSGSDALSVGLQSAICWVENVKDRVQPQNTWKPSEMQMTALRRVKNAVGGEGEIYEPLNSLYEDLKKLREE